MNHFQSENVLNKISEIEKDLKVLTRKVDAFIDVWFTDRQLTYERMPKDDNGRACDPFTDTTQTVYEEKQDNPE